MYRVVLIDDEFMIRGGLRTVIDWEDYGFCIVGEGQDGLSGEAVVLELMPDLILVDIRMPGQDGIELLRSLRAQNYKGRAIILTGYSEFKYAKEAISLEVDGYLLKPIEEEELIRHLEKVKDILDKKAAANMRMNHHEAFKQQEQTRHLLMGQKLEISTKDPFYQEDQTYHVVLMTNNQQNSTSTNPTSQNLSSYKPNSIEHVDVRDILSSQNQYSLVEMGDYLGMVFRGKTKRQLEVVLTDLQNKILHNRNYKPFLAIGNKVNGYGNIRLSFNEAKGILDRMFLYRNQQIVFFEDEELGASEKVLDVMDSDYLFGLVEVGNMDAIEVFFAKLEQQFVSSQMEVEKIKGICLNCMVEVREKLTYNYAESKIDYPEYPELLSMIYDQKRLADIMGYMNRILSEVSTAVCDGSSDNTMKRLLGYIHTNYYKDLKLEGLAKLFNYNPSYLGKIFKQETKINFNTYLDNIRIEHAKKLLASKDDKVYEIAAKVGYSSVDYFYAKFKKYVGVSPKVYKQQQSKE